MLSEAFRSKKWLLHRANQAVKQSWVRPWPTYQALRSRLLCYFSQANRAGIYFFMDVDFAKKTAFFTSTPRSKESHHKPCLILLYNMHENLHYQLQITQVSYFRKIIKQAINQMNANICIERCSNKIKQHKVSFHSFTWPAPHRELLSWQPIRKCLIV